MQPVREEVREGEAVTRGKLYKSLISLPGKKATDHRNNNSKKGGKFRKWRKLPPEIVSRILSKLDNEKDQQTLVECLVVSKRFYHAAKEVLYCRPHFTSTYRVAQFVTCLKQNEENGLMVRKLDLSKLRSGELTEFGGSWRDWQARYAVSRKCIHRSSVSLGTFENSNNNSDNYYWCSDSRGHRSNSSLSNSSSHSSRSSSGGSSGRESSGLGEIQGKWTSLWAKLKRNGQKHKKNTATTPPSTTMSSLNSHKRSSSVTTVCTVSTVGTAPTNKNSSSAYASYKDLPLGHLLHLLCLCKNVTEVDLSHLILSADFELPSSGQPQPKSMIPGVSAEPRAVYLTDSTNPWDISNNSYRNEQLTKLNPDIIFEILLERPFIRQLRMDNIVWVRQSMVSNYVLRAFNSYRENQMLSFNRSGLHRHLAWTCQAPIIDLVALIIMGHVASSDDLALQNLFPTVTQLHPDILEISQVFPIELEKNGTKSNFMTRLTILKTNGVTGHHMRKLCPQYLSLVVLLGENPTPSSQLTVVEKRMAKRAKITLRRLKELRNTDLRRALGHNYLAPVASVN